jgi:hypothetical protein
MNTYKRKKVDMTPKKMKTETAAGAEVEETAYKNTREYLPTAEFVPPPAPKRLIAYAPFDHDGEQYEPGDEFTPRKSWTRDVAFEEFRSIELKKGGTVGIAFTVPGDIIDKKTQERAYNRIILPLKEA